MPKKLFPTQISRLSGDALASSIVKKYTCWKPSTICFPHSFGVNDTYKVRTASKTLYLRVFRHKWRSLGEIQAEVSLLTSLQKNGISVSYPIPDKAGKYIQRVTCAEGIRYVVLFTEAVGKSPKMDASNCFTYGQLIANIHKYGDRHPVDRKRFDLDIEHLTISPLNSIKNFIPHRPKDYDYLEETGRKLSKIISQRLTKNKKHFGVCHGDHHGGNVHIDDHGRMTMFDFDCYGYGWRTYDLSVFLWSRRLADFSRKGKTHRTKSWNKLIQGYRSIKQISENELECAWVFVPIRHIWLMGLHIAGAANWGHNAFNDRYFDRNISFIKGWIKAYL